MDTNSIIINSCGVVQNSFGSNNNLILNASSENITVDTASGPNRCYIAPIRDTSVAGATGMLTYSTTNNEVVVDTSKTFIINHPVHKDKYLIHACLEGPEAGVYYRGKGKIKENKKETIISLPEYVDTFVSDFTVHLSSIGQIACQNLSASSVKDGKFTVYGEEESEFYWMVYGKRESIKIEPNKENIFVYGEGPYKWYRLK